MIAFLLPAVIWSLNYKELLYLIKQKQRIKISFVFVVQLYVYYVNISLEAKNIYIKFNQCKFNKKIGIAT